MKLLRRLGSLFRRDRLDADMAEEMRLHLEMQTERNRAAGMSADEARYAALRQFGNVASVQERARDVRGWRWLDELRQDVRSALRQIAKSPGFAVVVVLTLAFGIAVNNVLFGMVNLFFMRPSPLPAAERLVIVLHRTDMMKMPIGLSYPDYRDYRERLHSVDALVASTPMAANISTEQGTPQRTWIEVVSPDAFTALGVAPAAGRTLLRSDGEARGSAPVVVLSHDTWQTRFGGDPTVVGRAVRLNGQPFTVVGVAQAKFHGFHSMLAISAWVPVGAIDRLRPSMADIAEWRGAPAWRVTGRLKPGATIDGLRAEAAVVLEQLVKEYPSDHRSHRSTVMLESRARPDPSVAEMLPVFIALFVGLVVLVLFTACANVANLMIARAATRQRELTVRAALGASRSRLIRQLLVESLVLAAIAGVAGWFLGNLMGFALQHLSPQGDMPVAVDASPGWEGYAFVVGISLVAGLASGWLPALRATRIDLVAQLKQGPESALGGRHRLRNLLVIGQVTISLIVLISGGLFLQSLRRVQSVELGFRPERVLMLSYDLSLQGYSDERGQALNRELLARLRALPGIEAAALTSHMPFDNQINGREALPENPPPQLKDGVVSAKISMVSPGFIEGLGIRLRHGRTIGETDQANSPRVAVVNAAMADVCWPGQDAVGKRFRPWKDGPWIEVVGVTENSKYMMLSEPPSPAFFVPLTQEPLAPVTLAVRTVGRDSAAESKRVRAELAALDPQLPIYDVRTMDDLMGSSVFALLPLRMGMTVAAVQGGITLILSIMGLYAVVAFGVAQRAREIGIRMALGADPRRVVRLLVREGMRLSVVGAMIGLVIAALLGFGLSKVLYGLAPVEPLVFGGVIMLLLGTTAFACWAPARRAARVDPAVTLRSE